MKKIFLSLLVLPLLVFAQTSGELIVGDQTIHYDSNLQTESGMLYYEGDELVASEHGVMMIVYQGDIAILEAHDISGDGEYDAFVSLDSDGNVTKIEGEEASSFERPEPVTFSELLSSDENREESAVLEEDLVGPLDSITIPTTYSSLWFFVFLMIAAVGSWWYFRNKHND